MKAKDTLWLIIQYRNSEWQFSEKSLILACCITFDELFMKIQSEDLEVQCHSGTLDLILKILLLFAFPACLISVIYI